MKWFRFPHGMMSSGGVRDLNDMEVRVLIAMMCLASQSPPADRLDGALTANPTGRPLQIRSIHVEVWTSPDESATAVAIESLRNKGFVEQREDDAWRLRVWWQQFATDTSTTRVRKHRDKKKATPKSETPAPSRSLPEAQDPPSSMSEQTKPKTEQNRTNGNVAGNVSWDGFTQGCSLLSAHGPR